MAGAGHLLQRRRTPPPPPLSHFFVFLSHSVQIPPPHPLLSCRQLLRLLRVVWRTELWNTTAPRPSVNVITRKVRFSLLVSRAKSGGASAAIRTAQDCSR